MTETTYEVNREKLESLSIADLTGLITFTEASQWHIDKKRFIIRMCLEEMDKRIFDIIIF